MSRTSEIRWWKARPALDVSIVLVLATLSLAVGRARASDGISVEANLRYDGGEIYAGYESLVEVPRGGLDVDLWSHPGSGATVRPGQHIELFFETNADCYVTVVSIDPAGRARRLFPTRGEDGWVRGGSVYRLPDPHDYVDLVVTGPRGEERVFALASLYPMHDRYPRWWHDGPASRSSYYGDDAFFRTGWVVGDPVYEFGMFCEFVVPHPRHYESYSSAWVSFRVGGWKPVRHCCPVCGGLREPGHGVSLEIHWYTDHGHIDFRSHRRPVFLNASCVCDSRPRGKVKWVHTSSGWDRDDKDRHDKDRHDGDRHVDRDDDRGRDKDRDDQDPRDKDRHYADDRGSHDRHDSDDHRSDDGRHDGDGRRHDSDGRRSAVQDDDRHRIDRERGDRGSDHAKSNEREKDRDAKVDHRKQDRDVATRDVDRSKVDDADRDDDRARERSEARPDRGKGQDKKGRDLGPNGKSRKSRGRER